MLKTGRGVDESALFLEAQQGSTFAEEVISLVAFNVLTPSKIPRAIDATHRRIKLSNVELLNAIETANDERDIELIWRNFRRYRVSSKEEFRVFCTLAGKSATALVSHARVWGVRLDSRQKLELAKQALKENAKVVARHLSVFGLRGERKEELAQAVAEAVRTKHGKRKRDGEEFFDPRVQELLDDPKSKAPKSRKVGRNLAELECVTPKRGNREHRRRMVDFMFLDLVKVYNDSHIYAIDATAFQAGKGRRAEGTMGCHSIILPSKKRLNFDGNWEHDVFGEVHASRVSNSTVVLKTKVNLQVDKVLENHLRPKAVEILNRVASLDEPEYGPEEGLRDFVKEARISMEEIGENFTPNREAIRLLQKEGLEQVLLEGKIDSSFFTFNMQLNLPDGELRQKLVEEGWESLSPNEKKEAFRLVQREILSHKA